MTSQIKISDLSIAEDSLYKKQRVKIGSKSFLTPSKGIDLGRNLPGITTNNSIRGLAEIYKIFNAGRIEKIRTTSREQDLNNEISRKFRKYCDEDEVKITFTEFEEGRFPNEDELEYLTDLSHVHSDFVALPLLPKIARSVNPDNIQEYIDFVKKAISVADEMNTKPILGIVPMPIPSAFLPNVLETYQKENINSLCLDFQGSTMNSSLTKIRAIAKWFKKNKYYDDSFVYCINLGSGKLPKSTEAVPAKDILAFGYGFDSVGGQHIRKKLPPEVRAKILSSKNLFQNATRLFNKEDYGYHQITNRASIKQVYPEDSGIPESKLVMITKNKGIDKLFNQEQQGLEALRMRTVIAEEHKTLKYLEKKKFVEAKDIKSMENIKKKKV